MGVLSFEKKKLVFVGGRDNKVYELVDRKDELINAAETIKGECGKHSTCEGCFYSCIDEEGHDECTVYDIGIEPARWNISQLSEKPC